jgi:hypothetical protein
VHEARQRIESMILAQSKATNEVAELREAAGRSTAARAALQRRCDSAEEGLAAATAEVCEGRGHLGSIDQTENLQQKKKKKKTFKKSPASHRSSTRCARRTPR